MCWQSDAQSNFPPQPALGRDDEKVRVFRNANGRSWALNVTCGNATIPSLSGDKRTHRDDRPSVVRDPLRKSSTYQARAATWPLSLALMKREASGRGQPAGGDGASP
jgi:hypothetical protein